MNIDRFYAVLKDPSLLNNSSLEELRAMVEAYPYASNLHLLYLLNLVDVKDHKSKEYLATAALYAGNRAKLKYWVEYIQNPPVLTSITKDAKSSSRVEQDKAALLSLLRKRMKMFKEQKEESKEANKILPKNELIERFLADQPSISRPDSSGFYNPQQEAIESTKEDVSDLVTETLANIYIQQGLVQKAIGVFEKLILKYPKKSSYFAARIEELSKNTKT